MLKNVITLFYFALFVSCVTGSRILCWFPTPSISHQIVFQPIWRELSLRGHQVTVITTDPLNDAALTNLTEINLSEESYTLMRNFDMNKLIKDAGLFSMIKTQSDFFNVIMETQFNNIKVQQLLKDPKQTFDLILIEGLYSVLYGLHGKYKAPIIGVTSIGLQTIQADSVGNPGHPILYPELILASHTENMSLFQKINSFVFMLYLRYNYYNNIVPKTDIMAKKYIDNNLPHILDLERNVSMLFITVNPLIYPPRATVPAIIEITQIHVKPPKTLPKDLKNILDNAPNGVVYFSLGSNVKSNQIDNSLRRIIMDALGELPFTVLWKFESDDLPGKPTNVFIRKWLPQQDVLAHPNIKVFVTQGGLQSTEEAIARGVPLVGLPFIGDQPMNVQRMANAGIAVGLNIATVTKDSLKYAIIEVATNNSYRKKICEIRDLIKDQPMTSLEKAIWWSEYVIRHKGAKSLRTPFADISWFDFLMVDVILVLVLIPIIALFALFKVVQKISKSIKHKVD